MAKVNAITFKVNFKWWFYITILLIIFLCVLFNIKQDLANNQLFKYSIRLTKV